jgi:hypothetical protein
MQKDGSRGSNSCWSEPRKPDQRMERPHVIE